MFDCSLLLMNWCVKVEECFSSKWYINNWEHSSGFPLAVFVGVLWDCVGIKFWVQGVASAVLEPFWHCFCCDWAGIYLCEISLSRVFVWPDAFLRFCTYCIYTARLWYIQLCLEKGIARQDQDCDTWPFCLEKFALFYHHQSCWYKFESYINCCLAGSSLKQETEHLS